MPEKKMPAGLLAVDPDAQKYIRDITKPFVAEMVMILAEIARNDKAGPRDRMKAAVRVIDYHARGGSSTDMNADGTPSVGIIVLNASNTREMDEAADELRRLNKLTVTSTKQ